MQKIIFLANREVERLNTDYFHKTLNKMSLSWGLVRGLIYEAQNILNFFKKWVVKMLFFWGLVRGYQT